MLNNVYYIWGAGQYGARLIEFMKDDLAFKAVIDNDPAKRGTVFCGLPVVSYDDAKGDLPEAKIVIALNLTTTAVRRFLIDEGFAENHDFYVINDFFPRFYWEKNKSLVIKSFDIAVTTMCNMKCNGCQVFIPIAVKHQNLNAETIMTDIDSVFNYIDRTMNLNCAVGENLLNEELPDICEYLHDNYFGRYGYLTIQTNGTIIPKDDSLRRYCKSGTIFGISNYPENASTTRILIDKFNDFGVKWYYNSAGGDRTSWIDYGDPRIIRETDPALLCELYQECWKPGMGLYNGWLYICSLQMWSLLVPELGTTEAGDAFDLRQPKTENTRAELYKVISRQPPKAGYLSQCMRCNGVMTPYKQKADL